MHHKKNQILWKEDVKQFLIIVIFCIGVLFCCSGASPLINNVDYDSSVFFVVGRGMKHGLVPYRDLFDHKGLYLYALNCLAACISEYTSIGIFLVEIIFVVASAYIGYKLFWLFGFDQFAALIASFLFVGAIVFHSTYEGGNLIEEYVLTFQVLSFYLMCKDSKDENLEHCPCYMFVHGVCAAVAAFGFRANMALMWVGFAVIVLVKLIVHQRYKNIMNNLLAGMVGVGVGVLPIVVYGLMTHSLKDMVFSTFTYNLIYAQNEQGLLHTFLKAFSYHAIAIILVIVSISWVILLVLNVDGWLKAEFTMMLVMSLVAVCLSGSNFGHYFEYLIPFLLPIIGCFVWILKKWCSSIWNRRVLVTICCLLLAIFANASLLWKLTGKMDNSTVDSCKEALQDAGMCDRDKEILVTGNHTKYYNRLGMIPSERYFYIPGTAYEKFPDAIDAQVNSILSIKNDILVVFYENYGEKIIYSDTSKNEQISDILNHKYQKLFDSENEGVELYIKI